MIDNGKLLDELNTAGVPAVGVTDDAERIALDTPYKTDTGQWLILDAATTPATSSFVGTGAPPAAPPGSMLTDAENVVAAHVPPPPQTAEEIILATTVDWSGLLEAFRVVIDKGDMGALEDAVGVSGTDTGRDDTLTVVLTGDEDDFDPGVSGLAAPFLLRLDPGGAHRTITGLLAPIPVPHARVVHVVNVGTASFDITLTDEDASSAAENRFLGSKQGPPGPPTFDVTLRQGDMRALVYDQTSDRWRVSS